MKKYKKFRKQLINEKKNKYLKFNFHKTTSFLSESIIPPYPIETLPKIDYIVYPPRLIFENNRKLIITIEENPKILTEPKCYPKEKLNLILKWIKKEKTKLLKHWNIKTPKILRRYKLALDDENGYGEISFVLKDLNLIIYIPVKYKNFPPRIRIKEKNCNIAILIARNPRILDGKCNLKEKNIKKLFKWIRKNRKILRKYWNMKIDSYELIKNIKNDIK